MSAELIDALKSLHEDMKLKILPSCCNIARETMLCLEMVIHSWCIIQSIFLTKSSSPSEQVTGSP